MSDACRLCSTPLSVSFCDLGESPLSNAYLTAAEVAQEREPVYPLHAFVCTECKLVQVPAMESPVRIFSDYLYFSSFSASWVEHARLYTEKMLQRLKLDDTSLVMEIASNDGYLLQHFVSKEIPVLGIEPAANVAAVAREKGIPTEVLFFGAETAKQLVDRNGTANLIVANNVIAHVPDLHDFIAGIKIALHGCGTATFEFPHLLRLIEEVQFDTIYHEHFSYFAVGPLKRAFHEHGLEIVDVEELPTHGGSLRAYVAHSGSARTQASVERILQAERARGLDRLETYTSFQAKVDECKAHLLEFIARSKGEGLTIAGYGAPAKGNTLLNYCKVDKDSIPFTVDRSPYKQGRFLPGSHIPILSPDVVYDTKPDILLILPWNLTYEVISQMHGIKEWGGKFAVAIPQAKIVE